MVKEKNMAESTKNMTVGAGSASASVTATVTDRMPGVPCPTSPGYEYTGMRYVPVFADPPEWSSANSYEPLEIVIHQGNSYTSKTFVPVGIDISDPQYWALTGNYNAQVEQYRQEVSAFDGRITKNSNDIAKNTNAIAAVKTVADNLESHVGTEFIVIGDSWSDTDPSTTTYIKWPMTFQKYTRMNIHNYARNGASVVGSTPDPGQSGNFLGQVNKAINDTSFDHSRVGLIVIMGGVNDYRSGRTFSDVAEAWSGHIASLTAAFPKARIVSFLNYQIFLSRDEWNWTNLAKRIIRERSGCPVHSMIGWVSGSQFIADKVHPNDAGYRQLCSNMIACCFGGNPVFVSTTIRKTVAGSGGASMDFIISEHFAEDAMIRTIQTINTGVSSEQTITLSLDNNTGLTSNAPFYSWGSYTDETSGACVYAEGTDPVVPTDVKKQPVSFNISCMVPKNGQTLGNSFWIGNA
jgi:hypothetical protein